MTEECSICRSLFDLEKKGKETEVQGRKKVFSFPIEHSILGKRVNNAARHTAWRLCGAIAMATPFSTHIFNEKVMRET